VLQPTRANISCGNTPPFGSSCRVGVPEGVGKGQVVSTTSANFITYNLPLEENTSLIAMNALLPIKTSYKKAK